MCLFCYVIKSIISMIFYDISMYIYIFFILSIIGLVFNYSGNLFYFLIFFESCMLGIILNYVFISLLSDDYSLFFYIEYCWWLILVSSIVFIFGIFIYYIMLSKRTLNRFLPLEDPSFGNPSPGDPNKNRKKGEKAKTSSDKTSDGECGNEGQLTNTKSFYQTYKVYVWGILVIIIVCGVIYCLNMGGDGGGDTIITSSDNISTSDNSSDNSSDNTPSNITSSSDNISISDNSSDNISISDNTPSNIASSGNIISDNTTPSGNTTSNNTVIELSVPMDISELNKLNTRCAMTENVIDYHIKSRTIPDGKAEDTLNLHNVVHKAQQLIALYIKRNPDSLDEIELQCAAVKNAISELSPKAYQTSKSLIDSINKLCNK